MNHEKYEQHRLYFDEAKKNTNLDLVFKIFLGTDPVYQAVSNSALEASFQAQKIIVFTENQTSWLALLRGAKDSHGYSVLAYALAGNISIERFQFLLKHYQPTVEELKESLLFSAYYGKLSVFIYINERLSSKDLAKEQLLDVAMLGGHKEMVNHLFSLFPSMLDVYLNEWKDKLKANILLSFHVYIFRSDDQPMSLSTENDEKSYSPSRATKKEKERRERYCEEKLKELFTAKHDVLKNKYLQLSIVERKNADLFVIRIALQLQILIRQIKKNNFEGFKQQLWNSIENAENDVDLQASVNDHLDDQKMPVNETCFDDDSFSYSEKQRHFISRFAEQFDQTYQFYKCISSGKVVEMPDDTAKFVEMAKEAAKGVLPNINISAPMLGIPAPFSFSLPTGVAVAAVIDVCMYIREQRRSDQAKRVGRFFDGSTLRGRTNNIYDCAEFLAKRFSSQMERLDHTSIPNLADMAVARIFNHAMTSDASIKNDERWVIGTIARKMESVISYGRPEPGITRKTLVEVATNALSKYEHDVFSWNEQEEAYLTLDENIPINTSAKDWTVKGIFEHTGICDEQGALYAGNGQEVDRYGFIKATREEALKREMKPFEASHNASWSTWLSSFFGGSESSSSSVSVGKKPITLSV